VLGLKLLKVEKMHVLLLVVGFLLFLETFFSV
jgi:hypothetical protein